jgi:sugar O-acyltransferase (sialic acid O-acetyltransferase NeuD family)
MGCFGRIVFLDDDPAKGGTCLCECEVIGGVERLGHFAGSDFVIAVGDNRKRAQNFRLAIENRLLPTALVHPSAVVSSSASIGRGTVIMPGVIVNAGAVIGENCIINSGAVIEHDCRIGAHAHISPRAALGGGVTVGTLAHVGIGAVVLPYATIGEESIVGAGAVVLREAPARCTVVGVPARTLSYA